MAAKKHPFKINGKEWDKELVINYVCMELASSSLGLYRILSSAPVEMPSRSTVNLWLSNEENKVLSDRYARAKEAQADYLAEEILDISDNEVGSPVIIDDVPLVIDGQIVKAVDAASVAHAKLRTENRKWIMAKLKPKTYGDKTSIDHSSSDGSMAPRPTTVELVAPDVESKN